MKQLTIKKNKDNLLDVLIDGRNVGQALAGNRPIKQISRSIHYLLNRVDPSISRDLIEYELNKLEE